MSKSKFSKADELFKSPRAKIISGFILLIVIFMMPSLFEKYKECNKSFSQEFKACVYEKYPVGSNFLELKKFLESKGFKQAKNEPNEPKDFFYFFWWANDISNYKIIVVGNYNGDFRITRISTSP